MTDKIYAIIAAGLVADIVMLDAAIDAVSVFGTEARLADITAASPAPARGDAATNSGSGWVFGPPPAPPAPTEPDALKTLAQYRYQREIAGVNFQAAGASAPSMLGTDRDAQSKLNAAFVMATSGHWIDATPWKMADGSFVPLTAADVEAMTVAAATYVANCFANEAALAAQIRSGNLTADITVGWPSQG